MAGGHSGRRQQAGRGRYGGRYGMTAGQRPVAEQQRIQIDQLLEEFRNSTDTEFTFPPNLSNHDRAVVHETCLKYGFTSKSHGAGPNRQVTVYRPKSTVPQAASFRLPIAPDAALVLTEHFKRYAPAEQEVRRAVSADAAAPDGPSNSSAAATRRKVVAGEGAFFFSQQQIAERHEAWTQRIVKPDMQSIIGARQGLPIAEFRQQISETCRSHQVVLVAGETGCGKTTQVPQFLLEDAWSRQQPVRVLCSQPRRISAVSVAERVAAERGEPVSCNVGYRIRLEGRGGVDCALMFCTNGVLLRMLTQGEEVKKLSHIIVDEIHERDKMADFLLIVLRDLVRELPHLRVVLMSATLNAELFSDYFGGCPIINIPGFLHPVEDYYLEDVLQLTGYADSNGSSSASSAASFVAKNRKLRRAICHQQQLLDEALEKAFTEGDDADWARLLELTGAASGDEAAELDDATTPPLVNHQHSGTGATALMVAAGKGKMQEVQVLLANGADADLQEKQGRTAEDWARQFGFEEVAAVLESHQQASAVAAAIAKSSLTLSTYQHNTDADEVDLELIHQLLEYICQVGKHSTQGQHGGGEGPGQVGGAVLVFLPGWDEIMRLKEKLEAAPEFGSDRAQILPLHSLVSPADQRRVFLRPPTGVRKIVLATNIAETAITIDDIVCVINAGRLKEKSYDPYMGVGTLQAAWISQAAERQRRGRAGRCQAGVCFHMYSKTRSQAMVEFPLPEIKRSPLDELCLQIKAMEGETISRGTRIATFLAKAIEPPLAQAVQSAVELLVELGALDDREQLTVLGHHLAALPLPPRLGKLIMFALLFRCLDPILTVACSMSYREPFILPMDKEKRERAQRVKKELAGRIGAGSDHLLLIQTYKEWREHKLHGRERAYCSRSFLSNSTMMMIDGMREQLQKELQDRHLITSLQDASRKAGSMKLVRSLLLLGLYPFTGRVLPAGSSRSGSGRDGPRQMLMTAKNNKVVVHPGSITNAAVGALQHTAGTQVEELRLMVFDEVMRGESSMYVRQCSLVPPHALVLVASKVLPCSPRPRDVAMLSSGSEWSDMDEEELPAADEQLPGQGRKRTGHGVGGQQLGDQESAVLAVDGWLELEVPFPCLGHICCLRERISAAFAFKVQHPQHALPPMLQDALDTTAKVLTSPCATLPALDPAPAAARPRSAAEAAAARGRGRAPNAARCPVPSGASPGRQAGHSGPPPRTHAGGRGGRGIAPGFPAFGMTHQQVLAHASAGVSPVQQPPAPPLPTPGVMVLTQPQPPPPPPPPHGAVDGRQTFVATQPTRQPAPPPPLLRHPQQPRHHQHHHHQPHQAVLRQQLPPPPPPPPPLQQDAAKGDSRRGRGRGRSRGGGRSGGRSGHR